MLVVELHSEHGVRERLDDSALDLNYVVSFSHARPKKAADSQTKDISKGSCVTASLSRPPKAPGWPLTIDY